MYIYIYIYIYIHIILYHICHMLVSLSFSLSLSLYIYICISYAIPCNSFASICNTCFIPYICQLTNTGVGQLDSERTTGSTILIQGCDDLSIVNRIIRTMSLRTLTMFSCRDTLMLNMCLLIRRMGLGKVSSILHLAQRLTRLWM